MYHEPTFPSRHGALYLRVTLAYATVPLTSLPADMNMIISFRDRCHHKNHHHHFYFIITLIIITFITTLTILLSASHVHEIGILALQVDEWIVMKLMMSSKE
jgi:glycopeptide antibiotics resistance protein